MNSHIDWHKIMVDKTLTVDSMFCTSTKTLLTFGYVLNI